MSRSSKDVLELSGYFTEKEYGKIFEYIDNEEFFLAPLAHGGKNVRYPHKIFVGPLKETRYAFVKSNVAHVVTDELSKDGNTWFKVELWNIIKHRKMKK